ncbi:protein YABBY 6-like isoform X2 [Phragmites australis]|uniref:protein YABBY 6-like isoform X2 n=1 Tax=Phragmites australis TaxID=29695 RepID=UPI002D76F4B2|nr:protein YABBY 6-like isoform X2 [Phragmites australis]
MSSQIALADHVCYVHCSFCNTVLAVSVPGNSMLNMVTVRCGHCTNLLSVNLRGLMHSLPEQDHPLQNIKVHSINGASRDQYSQLEFGSSSSKFLLPMMYSAQNDHLQEQALNARPPEKRQRVPSAYNRFIKEEIRRIKANKPDISHREAFSTAAKNWAHYPNIHFGISPDREGGKKLVDETVAAAPATKKIQGFY